MLRLFARNHGNARNVRTDAEESRMERPEQTPVTARADAVSNIFLFLDGKNVGNTYISLCAALGNPHVKG